MWETAAAGAVQREREELEAILNAKAIARSPSILRLARYIGEKYFAGEGESVKEYNIAVEALGRSSDFDPKVDSIVRVEAHRLRRKLDEYYRTEGRDHKLRLILEPGQYVPKFVAAPASLSTENKLALPDLLDGPVITITAAEPALAALPAPRAQRLRVRKLAACAAALVLVATAAYLGVRLKPSSEGAIRAPIRILTGYTHPDPLISSSALNWGGDRWFSGGIATVAAEAAVRLDDSPLHSQRQGNFSYAIPLPPGVYELRLYFAPRLKDENTLDTVQTRRFAVYRNGERIMDPLDPINGRDSAGKWVVRVYRNAQPEADGKLHLDFRSAADPAYVSGIEISPGEANRLMPIRIISRTAPVVDGSGRAWSTDHYVEGGTLTARTGPFPAGFDSNLFGGERYGNFTYNIPLARGRYTVRLYFAETWFTGTPLRIGSRRFDVYANGMPLLEDFDILREAGASYRSVRKEFRGLRPDAGGYLRLSFVPRVNFACLNALEILDEGR